LAPNDRSVLQALSDIYPDGCDITLAGGEYLLDAPIRLPSWVRLRGLPGARPRLHQAPGSNGHILTNADRVSGNVGIVLEGLDLVGNGDRRVGRPAGAGITWACGAYFSGARSVAAIDVGCEDIRQSGLHFTGAQDVAVLGLRARGIGWSVVGTTRSSNVWIEAQAVDAGWDGGHSAMHIDGGTGVTVVADLHDCTGQGVMIDSKAAPLRSCVVEGRVERCGRGVALIGQVPNPLESVAISGRFSNNRGEGVMVSNARAVTLIDVTAIGNGGPDLLLQGRLGARNVLALRTRAERIAVSGGSGGNWFAIHPLTAGSEAARALNARALKEAVLPAVGD
jgi:hypothetical protein